MTSSGEMKRKSFFRAKLKNPFTFGFKFFEEYLKLLTTLLKKFKNKALSSALENKPVKSFSFSVETSNLSSSIILYHRRNKSQYTSDYINKKPL